MQWKNPPVRRFLMQGQRLYFWMGQWYNEKNSEEKRMNQENVDV